MKTAMFSMVLVFLLVMSLAGGCVPTVIAEDARPPAQAVPAVASLDDPQELERFPDGLIAGRMEQYHIPSEAVAAWMGWGASNQRPYWSLAGRAHYTLLLVAGVAFSWWLNYWNLLGAAF